jgi:hypothetical protein
MKKIGHGSISALLFCLFFAAAGNCQDLYQVKLQDGRILRVRNYYEKDGTIFLLRYGNYVGIEKSQVVEIVKVDEKTTSDASNPPKPAEPSAKAAVAATPKSQKGGTLARWADSKDGKGTDAPEWRNITEAQKKSEEERLAQEEQRQRESREQSLADMETNRRQHIEELEQMISRFRDEREQMCTPHQTSDSAKPSMPAPKSAEEMVGRVNGAGAIVGHCSYLTDQINELEKKLQGLKDTDAAAMLDNPGSKEAPAPKSRKKR